MRKVIKKIATVVASVSMVAAMGISAFAADEYQLVGNPALFGIEDGSDDSIGWKYDNEDQWFKPADGLDGVYVLKPTYKTPDTLAEMDRITSGKSRQFKVLADGQDMAWNYQMCLGNPEAAWADNQTQFEVVEGALKDGEYSVYMDPAQGFVCLIQDKKNVDLLARYHSRDEDSWNFVATRKAAFIADGYDEGSVYFDDAKYIEFINKCLAAEGGEAITALYDGGKAPSYNGDTTGTGEAIDDTSADASATPAVTDDTTTTTDDKPVADTAKTSEKKDDKDDDGLSGGAIAGICAAVVAVIAGIAVAMKKKN